MDQETNQPQTGPEFNPARPVMSYLWVAYQVIRDTRGFFSAMPMLGYKNPAAFTAISFAIPVLVLIFVTRSLIPLLSVPMLAVYWMLVVWLIHLATTKLMDGQGSLEATFRVTSYCSFTTLLSPVPYIGMVGHFFGLFLTAQGLSELHRISIFRAVAAILVVVGALMAVNYMLFQYILSKGVFPQ